MCRTGCNKSHGLKSLWRDGSSKWLWIATNNDRNLMKQIIAEMMHSSGSLSVVGQRVEPRVPERIWRCSKTACRLALANNARNNDAPDKIKMTVGVCDGVETIICTDAVELIAPSVKKRSANRSGIVTAPRPINDEMIHIFKMLGAATMFFCGAFLAQLVTHRFGHGRIFPKPACRARGKMQRQI